jgi:hypothetical protein
MAIYGSKTEHTCATYVNKSELYLDNIMPYSVNGTLSLPVLSGNYSSTYNVMDDVTGNETDWSRQCHVSGTDTPCRDGWVYKVKDREQNIVMEV